MNSSVSCISSKPQEGEGESMTATLAAQNSPERFYIFSLFVTFFILSLLEFRGSFKRGYLPALAQPFSELPLSLSPVPLGYHGTYPQHRLANVSHEVGGWFMVRWYNGFMSDDFQKYIYIFVVGGVAAEAATIDILVLPDPYRSCHVSTVGIMIPFVS